MIQCQFPCPCGGTTTNNFPLSFTTLYCDSTHSAAPHHPRCPFIKPVSCASGIGRARSISLYLATRLAHSSWSIGEDCVAQKHCVLYSAVCSVQCSTCCCWRSSCAGRTHSTYAAPPATTHAAIFCDDVDQMTTTCLITSCGAINIPFYPEIPASPSMFQPMLGPLLTNYKYRWTQMPQRCFRDNLG